MASTLDTPVLIMRGGPAGLTLACVLARHGVNCILAERNPSRTRFPKMDITNGVSTEMLRRLSADGPVREVGVAPQHSFDVTFARHRCGGDHRVHAVRRDPQAHRQHHWEIP